MNLRVLAAIFVSLAFFWGAQEARAGAIRFAGKKIAQGSSALAGATADGAQAAGGGVATAGRAAGGAFKAGVVSVGKGAKATPGLAARGAKATGKGLGKLIW